MEIPELTFVAGPNAAGKSSFIRTRANELENCEIIMTDVYKSRTSDVFREALKSRKNIILETLFNDIAFKNLVEEARNLGYQTSLIVLFLDTIQDSIDRVAFRSLEQNGLYISGNNIRINFNECFKNIARFYFYFDQADFIYTGFAGKNKLIMSFRKMQLVFYRASELQYPQKFADFASHDDRLTADTFECIKANKDFDLVVDTLQSAISIKKRLEL